MTSDCSDVCINSMSVFVILRVCYYLGMWKRSIFMPLLPLPLPLPFCSSNTSSYPTHQNGSGQSLPHPYYTRHIFNTPRDTVSTHRVARPGLFFSYLEKEVKLMGSPDSILPQRQTIGVAAPRSNINKDGVLWPFVDKHS